MKHRDPPAGTDRRDERRPIPGKEAEHCRQSPCQDCSVLRARKPLGRQNERRDAGGLEGSELCTTMPDRFVFSEDDPRASTNFMQPDFVGSILREVIGVDLDLGAGQPQGLRDGVAPEVAIDEEDGSGPLTRRRGSARSGSLPRSRLAACRSR
jgi:hypothetical protein